MTVLLISRIAHRGRRGPAVRFAQDASMRGASTTSAAHRGPALVRTFFTRSRAALRAAAGGHHCRSAIAVAAGAGVIVDLVQADLIGRRHRGSLSDELRDYGIRRARTRRHCDVRVRAAASTHGLACAGSVVLRIEGVRGSNPLSSTLS
ncbi:MAG TPA: hypothetical protein VE441_06540 [Mycobacterium sp.]|nr:hypothetical protein [Mycobacterium sp.]